MFGSSRGGVRGGQDQFSWEDVKTDKQRENYLGDALSRRTWPRCASGTARSELRKMWTGWWAWAAPGGHRDTGFQSGFILPFFNHYHHFSHLLYLFIFIIIIIFHVSVPSGSAGRVMLSKEDKEAAKMGLSVFTVRRGRPASISRVLLAWFGRSAGLESGKKAKKEKKKRKKKKHKKEKKKDKHHKRAASPSSSGNAAGPGCPRMSPMCPRKAQDRPEASRHRRRHNTTDSSSSSSGSEEGSGRSPSRRPARRRARSRSGDGHRPPSPRHKGRKRSRSRSPRSRGGARQRHDTEPGD
uniref:Chromosome 1 open reading frame 35 n=1 Tax=Anser brachyrhynchus TaxID=132585 RepID=A0A8B9BE42_9AVES